MMHSPTRIQRRTVPLPTNPPRSVRLAQRRLVGCFGEKSQLETMDSTCVHILGKCTTILYDTSMIWRSENGHARNYDHFKREMKSMDGSWGGCSNLSQKSMAFIWVIHHDPSHIALWSFLDLSLSIDIPFGMNRFVPQLGSLGLRQMRYCRSAG